MAEEMTTIPEVSGTPDDAYLSAALARAGHAPADAPVEATALTGGRTGAQVLRLKAGDRRYVLKQPPAEGWRVEGMGAPVGGEAELWLRGPVRALAGGVRFPVVDVAWDSSAGLFWMLMEDIGAGIRPRGEFTREDSGTLFRALAEMQSRFWETGDLEHAPLSHVAGTVRVFTAPLLHLTRERTSDAPWVAAMLDSFQVMPAFVPPFLEVIDKQVADDYLALCADESWLAALDAHPHTLLHGDLRRANIAFEDGGVALIDWEFAAIGPPACDLQWHCFLHYWTYPPDGVAPTDDHCHDLRDLYAHSLEASLGRKVDRAAFAQSWELGWIKIICQLGFLFADPLYPNGADADERARIASLAAAAVRRATRARDALG